MITVVPGDGAEGPDELDRANDDGEDLLVRRSLDRAVWAEQRLGYDMISDIPLHFFHFPIIPSSLCFGFFASRS